MADTLDAPLEFVRNSLPGAWSESKVSMHADKLPDRFTSVPGHNNYRGAKISHKSQVKLLKDKGVKHIISLSGNSYGNQRDDELGCGGNSNLCEPKWAEQYGMTWREFPLNKRKVLSASEWETVRGLMANGGVYFHCSHGVDRTGGLAARWRMELEKDLTHDEVFRDYTYKFGGAWQHGGDPNYLHRAWVKEAKFDPALLRRVKSSISPWRRYALIGAIGVPVTAFVVWGIFYLMSDDDS